MTHDPDDGTLIDADAVPSYLVYEDDSDVELAISGNMAKHDTKTGFYLKKIACTTANGFEINKTYTIHITADVAGDTGGITFAFRVASAAVGSGPVEWTYTATDSTTALPIANATVYAGTSTLLANVTYQATTNDFGIATFYLTAGTWYFWPIKSGINFGTLPDSEAVV